MGKKSRLKRTRKVIHLNREAQAAMKMQLSRFREKFGREPGPDDPVFFDPDSDIPVPYPADRMRREVAEAMVRAGICPEKIYATSKTGMLPTAQNMKMWSESDLAEWDAAVEEYRKLTEGTKQ